MALFQLSFYSKCLRRTVPLNVIIPCDGRRAVTHGSYRTLYLLHGTLGSKNEWTLGGGLVNISKMFDIAIVLPSLCNNFYIDNEKYDQHYGEFTGRELVEYTRSIFPLSSKREDTVIGGLSMGGFGAIHNAMNYSETFGHCVALSSPLMFNIAYTSDDHHFMNINKKFLIAVFGDLQNVRNTDADVRHLAGRVHSEGRDCPDLYLACGYNDMLSRENRKFHRFLTENGIPHTYEEGPGSHDMSFWRPYLIRGLEKTVGYSPRYVPPEKTPFWIEREPEGVK